MLATITTAAVALSGAAATPCDAHGLPCSRARAIVQQWQNSTTNPMPLYEAVRFRIGKAHWVCSMHFPYDKPYDLALCHRHKLTKIRFTLGVNPFPKPWTPCKVPLPVARVVTVAMNATNGAGCGTLERLILTRALPTNDTTVSDHPGWGTCVWHGRPGNLNASPPRPDNLVSFQCETLPNAQTSLTQEVNATFGSPLTPGSPFCRINANGDCTWNGEVPTS